MTNRRRIWAMAACTVIGGLLGTVACAAFPRRYTSSVDFWFYGGRRSFGPANRLVLRAVEEATGDAGRFAYPSYDFQKIPISFTSRDREVGREITGALMASAMAAGDRMRMRDEPEGSTMWLEQASAPTLTSVHSGEYTWTGLLRLHTPAPLRLDRALLRERVRDVVARIGSERFLQRLIWTLPLYRLEMNGDATALKRFTAVVRRNLRFDRGPQEDVLRISYTCDDAQQARALLNQMVTVFEQQSRGAEEEELGKQGTRQAWPFEVVGSASLPGSGDGVDFRWSVGTGLGMGLLLGWGMAGLKGTRQD